MNPSVPLQVVTGLGGVALGVVLSAAVVALGTYVGVLMALQSYFDADRWSEVEWPRPGPTGAPDDDGADGPEEPDGPATDGEAAVETGDGGQVDGGPPGEGEGGRARGG